MHVYPENLQAVRLRSALALGARGKPQPVQITRDDLAFLQYTGGTTGVAKGAMLTHGNLIANLLQAKAWIADQVSGDVETVLTPLPLYHIYSLTVNAFIFMGLGGRNILIANPRDMTMVMKIIRNETFTGITGINTLYNAFLDNEEFRKRDFSKLKLAMAGGMAMQRAVAERFQQVTGRPVVEGYGLTECSPIVTMNPVDLNDMAAFSGSIGLPAPSTVAASYRSVGMACNPARRMTMTNPRSFHADARMTDGIAQVGSVHHPGVGRCRKPRIWLTRPLAGLSSHCHTNATTTQLVTTGRKIAARKNDRPAIFAFSANANPNPPMYTSGRYPAM